MTNCNTLLNVFITTDFSCSTKYVKQVALVKHSWIFPTLQKEMGIGVLFILQKMGEGTFSTKKREVGKIVEKGCLGRVTYVCC